MFSQRNSVGTDKENVAPGNLCIIWKLNEELPLEKNSVTFLRLIKLLKRKKNSITALWILKFIILKKGLHHFFPTFQFINAEKDSIAFSRLLKVFNFENWLHHILMTLKVFQYSYSVECCGTAAYEGRLSYHIFINFTWSECTISKHQEYISFLGPNFPGMRGLILLLISNMCNLAVISIFLLVTWWLLLVLLVTTHYCAFPLLVWTFKKGFSHTPHQISKLKQTQKNLQNIFFPISFWIIEFCRITRHTKFCIYLFIYFFKIINYSTVFVTSISEYIFFNNVM